MELSLEKTNLGIYGFSRRLRELGRETREEIGKGNQMAALRVQTGGGHQIPPGLPSGDVYL